MNLKSFRQFTEETGKELIFTFGRFNPATTGHLKLLDKVESVAKTRGAQYRIYASTSNDPKKNPLEYSEKIKFMRKMFPKHSRNIVEDPSLKMALNILVKAYAEGFREITMVVGSDRIKEFDALMNKYNGQKARHGFYDFKKINVESAGDRDPDAEGVEGMSASKMRRAAFDNDFKKFKTGLPKGFKEGEKLFNLVRTRMGITESVELNDFDEVRERYITEEIFNVGDIAQHKDGTNFIIAERKTNFVVAEDGNKYFINDLKI